jgi:hypothetical protein
MAKAPAFQFYVRDWLSDSQLQMASFQTRGMWINFLCFMWEAPERGKLIGTEEQLAKLIGAKYDEIVEFAREATILEFCSYAKCDGIVTLINRRMYNEWKEKESARLRMQKMRLGGDVLRDCYGESDAIVTPISSTSSSTSTTNTKTLYRECVYLTPDEFKKLTAKYGPFLTDKAITILNNYLMSKGKDPYKSHYHTLIGWPMERAQERKDGKRDSAGGSGIPKEYVGESVEISDIERQKNLERVKSITATILPDKAKD